MPNSSSDQQMFKWPEDERVCLPFDALSLIQSSAENSILFRVLAIVDLVAIFITFILICYEHWEHSAKRRAKRKKLKTMITPEYLRYLQIQHLNKAPARPEDMTEHQVTAQFPVHETPTPTSEEANKIFTSTNNSKELPQTMTTSPNDEKPNKAVGNGGT